ncbi:Transmembrane protein 53 [Mytilus coruscus]|uniref:Transmembrane protein 53 n=1 Tax=Mytilus coruscus TaxID=42192 RepID=A0A6J8CRN4_MYTCO|nr:Transmembrane protein 53 [Mytilus coruscus]
MEEDDFEYDISFPAPRTGNPDDAAGPVDDFDDLGFDDDDDSKEPEPVVYLLGWAGCKDKYLAKYSQFYEQKGCISIRYIAPTNVTYFNPAELRNIAVKLLDLIPDYSLEDNPVFFHVFSNNGCFVYSQISDILCSGEHERFNSLKIKGCILDSAPGKRRITRAAYAFALASGKTGLFLHTTYIYILIYLFLTAIKTMICSAYYGKNYAGSPHTLYGRMKDDKSRWPQLFLCSKVDKVIPYTDSEEVMKYRSEVLKVSTELQCWDDSDHCQHLVKYRESYIANCYRFIDKYK